MIANCESLTGEGEAPAELLQRAVGLCVLVCLLSGCKPAPREEPTLNQWEKDIRAFEAKDRQAPPPQGEIVFVGSSSVRGWDLAKCFPNLKAINRGFGGSQLADSVRFADRIVTPCKPRIVVLYAGDNDIASGRTPERVLADFKAFVKKVRRVQPKARIVFISIKPSIARWPLAGKMQQANKFIEQFVKTDKRLAYVDIWPAMLGADGKPRKELFQPDGLHLSAEGYQVWTEAVRPRLK